MTVCGPAFFAAAAAGGGGSSPAWVQFTAPAQAGFSSTPTISFPVTTTSGNHIGVAFATGAVVSSVVGNLSGGGTVALTQRFTGTLTYLGETGYVYTVPGAAPVTSITINLGSGTNPMISVFEASDAGTYDTAAITTNVLTAAEHAASVTTTGDDAVIGVFGGTGGTISSVRAGYTQNGATNGGFFTLKSTTATGAAGSKTAGHTPSASTSSDQMVFALKA